MRKVSGNRKEPLSLLRKDRFKPVKGPYEPWYITISLTTFPFTVIRAYYECPHCGQLHHNRHTCVKHCIGQQGMYPATCYETKQGGKCYGGCTHE